jgi:hypothetical protein
MVAPGGDNNPIGDSADEKKSVLLVNEDLRKRGYYALSAEMDYWIMPGRGQ